MVRLGVHKETKAKVAVKILAKKDMSEKESELVRAEIDVLKMCQHPNIIRIYDVFENIESIFISKIMLFTLNSNGILCWS